jgi:glycosyltransferase involved in cell wall biosynthesis
MKFEDVTSIDVLFVHHLPLIGGATQSLYLIMKHAREEGLSSKVLFLHNEGEAIDYFQDAGFDVLTDDKVNTYAHAYGAYRSFFSRRPWVPITQMIRALLSVKFAQKLLFSLRPKVVYLNSSVLFPFAIAAKRLNIKVIWHLREQIHRGNLGVRKKMFQYFFNNFSTEVISISNVNAKAISLRRKRIHVVYNSVDLTVFNPSIDNSDFKRTFNIERELVVTFLGGNLKSKGAILFVEAAIIVLQKYGNIKFIITGYFNPNRDTRSIE